MTNANTPPQAFLSLHTMHCANGDAGDESSCLKQKGKEAYPGSPFALLPSPHPSSPGRTAGTMLLPLPLQESWDLTGHPLTLQEQLEPARLNSAWLRGCCQPAPLTLRGSDSNHSCCSSNLLADCSRPLRAQRLFHSAQ